MEYGDVVVAQVGKDIEVRPLEDRLGRGCVHGVQDGIFEVVGCSWFRGAHGGVLPEWVLEVVVCRDLSMDFGQRGGAGEAVPSCRCRGG